MTHFRQVGWIILPYHDNFASLAVPEAMAERQIPEEFQQLWCMWNCNTRCAFGVPRRFGVTVLWGGALMKRSKQSQILLFFVKKLWSCGENGSYQETDICIYIILYLYLSLYLFLYLCICIYTYIYVYIRIYICMYTYVEEDAELGRRKRRKKKEERTKKKTNKDTTYW